MKRASTGLVVVLSLLMPKMAYGKAAYFGKGQLVEFAEIIAIVDVSSVSETETTGKCWTYRQAASASTVKVLKGKLPDTFIIHAEKDFICARATYEANTRYMVFLQREARLYATVNHHLGQFKIIDDKLNWFSSEQNLSRNEQGLDVIIKDIDRLNVPLETRIADLSSDDGERRVAATRVVHLRRDTALEPLRNAGAKEIAPFGTISTRRIDMVYSLLKGLGKNPADGRAGYRLDSFGLHVKTGATRGDVVQMGKRHGFTLTGSFRPDGRPNCYVTLAKGKILEDVLWAVLLIEPSVVTANLNYFEG